LRKFFLYKFLERITLFVHANTVTVAVHNEDLAYGLCLPIFNQSIKLDF